MFFICEPYGSTKSLFVDKRQRSSLLDFRRHWRTPASALRLTALLVVTARGDDLFDPWQKSVISREEAVQGFDSNKSHSKPQQRSHQCGNILGQGNQTVVHGSSHRSDNEPHKRNPPNNKRQVQFRVPLEVEADLVAYLCANSVYSDNFLRRPTAVIDAASVTTRASLADSASRSRQEGTSSRGLEYNSNSGHSRG
jgi:hypothetical protein